MYELSGDFKESVFEEAIILTCESVRQNQLNALNKARDEERSYIRIKLKFKIAKDISPEMTLLLSEEISPDSLEGLQEISLLTMTNFQYNSARWR